MFSSMAQNAIREKKCLQLQYDGFTRVVEVHVVGFKQNGGEAMGIWQIRGGCVSGEGTGFKLFELQKSFHAHVIDEQSHAPRTGYKRWDKTFKIIYQQV